MLACHVDHRGPRPGGLLRPVPQQPLQRPADHGSLHQGVPRRPRGQHAERDPGSLPQGAGRVFRPAPGQYRRGRRRRKDAQAGARRDRRGVEPDHPAHGQAQPSGAVDLPEIDLPRRSAGRAEGVARASQEGALGQGAGMADATGAGRAEVSGAAGGAGGRRRTLLPRVPFNLALVLPAQLTVLSVALVPTLIVIWLALTDWQPTSGVPWWRAEFVWFWNFYDLWYDDRFIGALLRTLFVVTVCLTVELILALGLGLALLFLDEWPWRKVAVSIIILPMMIIPVDAANAFFMLFNERGPVNHIISLVLSRDYNFSWLSDPRWALLPIMLAEIWQWTPLMFLLVLTGLMNLPQNQVRAAMVLGA